MLYYIAFIHGGHLSLNKDWTSFDFEHEVYHRVENRNSKFVKDRALKIGDFVFNGDTGWEILR